MNSTKILAIKFTLLLALITGSATAQTVALRTNLLYDATLSAGLGAEVRLDSTWSAGLNLGLNAWDINKDTNKKWRHVLIEPNVRKYFGDKKVTLSHGEDSLSYHPRYLEMDLIYSHFNVGNVKFPFGMYKSVRDRRLQGDLLALGGKYGYSWILSRDWRVEAEAGIAIGYAWFKEYDCDHCGTYYGKDDRIFLLPQLGINVVYIIN